MSSSPAAPPGPADGGADAPPAQDLPAASHGEEIQITGLVDVDMETGAELASPAEPAVAPEPAPEPAVAPEPAPEASAAPEARAAPDLAPAPVVPVRPWATALPVEADPTWAPSNLFLIVLTTVIAVADIASKTWVTRTLAGPNLQRTGKHVEVIHDRLDFIFAQNPGGAWSFLRGMPDGLRRPFFLFVSSAAIVFIVMVYRRLDRRQWAMRWGLPLALGGAIGNLADRIRYGWVVDFIDMYWKSGADEMHWPTFNVADIAIVVGVGLMALDLLSLRKVADPGPEAAAGTAGGAA